MNTHPHIVSTEQLRQLSGKQKAAAVRRWASTHGIRIIDGAKGPWTTLEALNAALGITPSIDTAYSPDIL